MWDVQIAVIILVIHGTTNVLGQFNFDYPDFSDAQRQPVQQQQFPQQQFQQQQLQQQQFQQQQFQQQQFQQQQSQQQQLQQQQFQQQQSQQSPNNRPAANTNDGNPRTRPPGNVATTSTPAPSTTTTAQPMQITQCRQNCPITSEYNPVCGTDGQSYNNMNVLRCARSCGINVGLQRVGPCVARAV